MRSLVRASILPDRGRAIASGDPVGGAARLPPIPIRNDGLQLSRSWARTPVASGVAVRRSSDIMFPYSVAALPSRAVTWLDKVKPLPWQSATLQLGC